MHNEPGNRAASRHNRQCQLCANLHDAVLGRARVHAGALAEASAMGVRGESRAFRAPMHAAHYVRARRLYQRDLAHGSAQHYKHTLWALPSVLPLPGRQ